jgi:hypothetical protein
MARRISQITVAALAVMAIAAPTALAGSVPGSANVDAHQRAFAGSSARTVTSVYPDAFDRALHAAGLRLNGAAAAGDSHNRFDLASSTASLPTVSSVREIEWPQIGIGFGVGILLAVAFWGAMRIRHIRPLAH